MMAGVRGKVPPCDHAQGQQLTVAAAPGPGLGCRRTPTMRSGSSSSLTQTMMKGTFQDLPPRNPPKQLVSVRGSEGRGSESHVDAAGGAGNILRAPGQGDRHVCSQLKTLSLPPCCSERGNPSSCLRLAPLAPSNPWGVRLTSAGLRDPHKSNSREAWSKHHEKPDFTWPAPVPATWRDKRGRADISGGGWGVAVSTTGRGVKPANGDPAGESRSTEKSAKRGTI